MTQAEGGVAGNRALSVEDARNANRRHVQLPSPAPLRSFRAPAVLQPGVRPDGLLFRPFCPSLVVIDNFNVRRAGRLIGPFKTDSPPVVDPDTVLSLSIANQRLKTIAGQGPKILQSRGRFQSIQLQPRRPPESGKSLYSPARGEVSRALVAPAGDQS